MGQPDQSSLPSAVPSAHGPTQTEMFAATAQRCIGQRPDRRRRGGWLTRLEEVRLGAVASLWDWP